MSQEYRRGPTDEPNREVAKQAGIRLAAMAVGFGVAYYATDPYGMVGLIVGMIGLIYAEPIAEGIARSRLWWDTRRYDR